MKLTIATIIGISTIGLASAAPFPASDIAAAVGQSYVYTTAAAGGSGDTFFKISSPPNGYYMASFAANFTQQGSVGSPAQFACELLVGKKDVVEATAVDIDHFYPGVSGLAPVHVTHDTHLKVLCSNSGGSTWKWGDRPLQVTLVKIAGEQTGSLSP